MKRSHPELLLSCAVADALRLGCRFDVVWTHFPAGEHRSKITGARLKRMGLRRGVPDYLFITAGGHIAFLELKAGKGRLSPEQMAWRDAVIALGCRYAIARTGQEAIEILQSWGILERVRAVA